MNAASLTKAAIAGLSACLLIVAVAELVGGPGRVEARPQGRSIAYSLSVTRYDLFDGDLTKIDRVSFALSPSSARDVWVRVDASGGWHPCEKRLTRFVCELPSPVDLVDTTALTVFAD